MKFFKFLLLAIFILIVAAGVTGFLMFRSALEPVDATKTEQVHFVVPKGQSTARIAERLAQERLIKHPLIFRLMIRNLGVDGNIQAGSFTLSQSMTPEELVLAMTKGKADEVRVTLLEGWRREEMAEELAEQEDLAEFDKQEFLDLTEEKEGYLFPDTYLVQPDFTTAQIVSLLDNTFERKIETGLASEIEASGKSLEDIITMASLIQREAKGKEQMRLVSGVLWNRIDVGMGLNVDATLQYIKGYSAQQKSWWVPPLAADKESSSPYNTYKFAGLPPGPIANPGLEAIEAALLPTETDYLYYIHDNEGKIHFGKTLDEHNANVQKYLR